MYFVSVSFENVICIYGQDLLTLIEMLGLFEHCLLKCVLQPLICANMFSGCGPVLDCFVAAGSLLWVVGVRCVVAVR